MKRRLRILSSDVSNSRNNHSTVTQTPVKTVNEITFGKKVQRSERIDKVITNEYLNESLRQKLRDRFQSLIDMDSG